MNLMNKQVLLCMMISSERRNFFENCGWYVQATPPRGLGIVFERNYLFAHSRTFFRLRYHLASQHGPPRKARNGSGLL